MTQEVCTLRRTCLVGAERDIIVLIMTREILGNQGRENFNRKLAYFDSMVQELERFTKKDFERFIAAVRPSFREEDERQDNEEHLPHGPTPEEQATVSYNPESLRREIAIGTVYILKSLSIIRDSHGPSALEDYERFKAAVWWLRDFVRKLQEGGPVFLRAQAHIDEVPVKPGPMVRRREYAKAWRREIWSDVVMMLEVLDEWHQAVDRIQPLTTDGRGRIFQ